MRFIPNKTAAACQSRCHRNMLIQHDLHTLADPKFLDQELCCFISNIGISCREKSQVGRKFDPRFFLLCQLYFIIQINGLHDHTHIMISVLSSSQYIQSQVYFCKCFQLNLIHPYLPSSQSQNACCILYTLYLQYTHIFFKNQ